MGILNYHHRPWVAFEASNREHRKWFSEFQQSGTWGHCPVRFIIADEQGDLVSMIQRRLINYYVGQEFRPAKKSRSRA